VSAPPPDLEPSEQLRAAWEAEESALERGDIEAAVAAVLDAWVLADAPTGLRERVAAMQRHAFEVQAAAGAPTEAQDPIRELLLGFLRESVPEQPTSAPRGEIRSSARVQTCERQE
jgi:hypothetical protein